MTDNYNWNELDKSIFLKKLVKIQNKLKTRPYKLNGHTWDDNLYDKIVNNYRPDDVFVDMIYRYVIKKNKTKMSRIRGNLYVISKKTYLKVDKNQWLILDSLFEHGSKKLYKDKTKTKTLFRYSEHAGLLDFNDNLLHKIVVYGDTNRVDDGDEEIYLPGELEDAPLYEYIFHTHPATPKPGGRANLGLLYEFPSLGDIFNFIDNHNGGKTQGSIIIAAEGMYIIHKLKHDLKKIKINEDELYKNYNKLVLKLQGSVIKKYGIDFTEEEFYEKIAMETKVYLDQLNDFLKKYKLFINFYNRIKNEQSKWVFDTIYLPVIPIEKK